MFVDRGCKLAIAQLLVLFRELNEHLGKHLQTGGTLRLSRFESPMAEEEAQDF